MKSTTIRELLAIIFRHRTLVALSFLGIFLGALMATFLEPRQYKSQMKILVKRERVDPVISAKPEISQYYAGDVTEEILNSEAAILKSHDLLEKVVTATGLDQKMATTLSLPVGEVLTRTARMLEGRLQVETLRRTNLIGVGYESSDPELTSKVLDALGNLYLEKHLAVHRPPGAFEFFQQQADQYRADLAQAEEQLMKFNREQGVASAQLEKENTLRKQADYEFSLRETQTALDGTQARIHILETFAAATPARITTQVRVSDNPYLHDHLKSELMTLELKKTDLLTRYDPSYRLIKEIDTKIAQIHAAIEETGNIHLRDETTDRNLNFDWVNSELAKAKSELASLEARAKSGSEQLKEYKETASRLEQQETLQQRLSRAIKTAEENYQLYQRKAEEARIADALDRKRIVNVAIAEPATAPRPSSPLRLYVLLMAGLLATMVSLAFAYIADYFDPTFRTPDEVEAFMNLPVLATIPKGRP
jgi:uncharacterized protein involved in exopolysaccharide biosynthesis